MQARYQATLQPEQSKGQKAGWPGRKQVLFLRARNPVQIRAADRRLNHRGHGGRGRRHGGHGDKTGRARRAGGTARGAEEGGVLGRIEAESSQRSAVSAQPSSAAKKRKRRKSVPLLQSPSLLRLLRLLAAILPRQVLSLLRPVSCSSCLQQKPIEVALSGKQEPQRTRRQTGEWNHKGHRDEPGDHRGRGSNASQRPRRQTGGTWRKLGGIGAWGHIEWGGRRE